MKGENMNIHIIQHVPFENPGLVLKWVEERGHTYKIVRMYNQERIPSSEEVDFLVVLGGPMSANDSDKWITQERRLIREIVTQGKPMFGICLESLHSQKLLLTVVLPDKYQTSAFLV